MGINDCDGSDNQEFTIDDEKQIVAQNSNIMAGWCVSLPTETLMGGKGDKLHHWVILESCDGTDDQKWELTDNNRLRNVGTDNCIIVSSGYTDWGSCSVSEAFTYVSSSRVL